MVQSVNINFLRLRIRTEHVTDATLLLEAVVETGNVATEAVRVGGVFALFFIFLHGT